MGTGHSDSAKQQLITDQIPSHEVTSKTFNIIDVCEKFDTNYSTVFVDEILVYDPYGFRLLVMEMSIASWTTKIGGVTWYSPYKKAPLFLVVNGEMFQVAEFIFNKNF